MTRACRLLMLMALGLVAPASAQTTPADATAIGRGRVVYQTWCATCHSAGEGMPGTAALRVKYKSQPAVSAVLTERTNLTAASIKFFVRNGVSVMPFFRKTEISDADLEAMALFLTRRGTP
jgi:mono/diheme cytochrome c family protein